MKLKHRSNLFLVVRELEGKEIPIAGFLTMPSADEYADVCTQELEEHGFSEFNFRVVPLIYYDV